MTAAAAPSALAQGRFLAPQSGAGCAASPGERGEAGRREKGREPARAIEGALGARFTVLPRSQKGRASGGPQVPREWV